MIKLLSGSIMCIFLLITSLAHSADYPDHPVNILTMTKPGAQIDLLTRALAEQLKKTWDQPVIVSNKPGGSHGSVMASELANAPNDGYSLGVSATGAFTYSPNFLHTTYKLDDFHYFTLLGLNQSNIICAPDHP